ncbi:glycosyltransferase family 2 protein [Nesterenkonia sp.]|uniref:glycosyltransferase family 2 protein n=1 Tax=Nesterenkonia sp. TaxID=704201 RepID=UPI0026372BA1|nr:glycosyltransferase family 2 protein [Nesterenkonia sp.]
MIVLKVVKVDSAGIIGWCYDPADPSATLQVNLVVDGTQYGSMVADVPLREAYPDSTADHPIGFHHPLPIELHDGEPHSIELVEPRSGARVSRTLRLENYAVSFDDDLFGQYQGTDKGVIRGWATADGVRKLPTVTIDEEDISVEHAQEHEINTLRRLYGFQALIPPKFYDGQPHTVRVTVSASSEQHLLGQEEITWSRSFRKLQTWRHPAAQHASVTVGDIRIINRTVTVDLFGHIVNRRAALRLGMKTVDLVLDSSAEPEDSISQQWGCYRGTLPPDVGRARGDYELFAPGDSLGRTYDLRLGDPSGSRPRYLPTSIDLEESSNHDSFPARDTLTWFAQQLHAGGDARLRWFSQLARETRSCEARDVLALAATGGVLSYRPLLRSFTSNSREVSWVPALLTLAQVVYSQRMNPQDLDDVLSIYRYAEEAFSVDEAFSGVDRSYYADLLTKHGSLDDARRILRHPEQNLSRAYSQQFLLLNTLNPATPEGSRNAQAWFSELNRILGEEGFAPIVSGETPNFFRLSSPAASPAQGDQPLVSIIMPVYEPNEATDVAIRSLLDQTWRNIEIIIIDDASPAVDVDGKPTRYREQLQSWAEQDERIRLILCEKNRGAYSVRNDAFQMARGEFVTVADKDDWHHPQRIEFQARDLMTHMNKPANIVNWVRVNEDLLFQVRWGPDRVVHPAFACIMFRRRQVMDAIGYWDPVRKSADNEYKRRLELVFGTTLQPEIQAPLAFSLLGEDNLTSSDFGLGYRHPDREAYQWAYSGWHDQIAQGASPRLSHNQSERPFPSPLGFLPDRDEMTVPRFDVVFAAEFGDLGGEAVAQGRMIRAAVEAGMTVGILPIRNGVRPEASRRRLAPEIRELLHQGAVRWLSWGAEAAADVVIIGSPRDLVLTPTSAIGLVSERVVVRTDLPPRSQTQYQYYYEVQHIDQKVSDLFGVPPFWAPQAPFLRDALEGEVAPERILENFGWTPSYPADSTRTRFRAAGSAAAGQPVIGRILDEQEAWWPVARVRKDAYPDDTEVRVAVQSSLRRLSAAGVVPESSAPASWAVEPAALRSHEDFIASWDFFVHYSSEVWDPHIEPTVTAALERGVVCVLNPSYAPVFGDAAVYAAPGEIRQSILQLWESAAKMQAQRQRGYDFLARHRRPGDFRERLNRLAAAKLQQERA